MCRIVLIDDDEPFRNMLTKTLVRAGHEVREAKNGRIGLEVCEDSPPDLVITDLVMPEQEGVATIMELRRCHPKVKIIAISGGGRHLPLSYLEIARHLGAEETLAKPFSHEEILEAIDRLSGRCPS